MTVEADPKSTGRSGDVPPKAPLPRVIDLDNADKDLKQDGAALLDTKWLLKQCYHRLYHFNILCVGKLRRQDLQPQDFVMIYC